MKVTPAQSTCSIRSRDLDKELAVALEGSTQSLHEASREEPVGALEKVTSENDTDQTSSGFFEMDEEDVEIPRDNK